jgi:hypothetical protein
MIAGAGPTGLVLALWLQRLGVRVRIVDKAAEPGTTSRALVVHARTLELYRQMGIADSLVGEGLHFAAVNLWVRGRQAARVAFGDIGAGVSPYPYMLIYPQDQHERFLIDRLKEKGVHIDRPTEVVGFEERGNRVAVQLKRSDGSDETSELSVGVAGKIHGGDRLPWVRLDPLPAVGGDNFAPLTSIDWQVHVYGDVTPAISNLCKAARLPLHKFVWQEAMRSAGFVRNAVYLIRPDGYVGFADRDANAANLQQYLNDQKLRPRAPS